MTSATISRRTVLAGAAGGVATGALAGGCAGTGTGSASDGIRVMIVPDPVGASEFYRDQFAAFTADTGIAVEILENPASQAPSAIDLMFRQGNAPDVFRLSQYSVLIDKGFLAPLNDYATTEIINRFPKGSMDPLLSGLHRDGQLYGLPLTSNVWPATGLFIYNKQILADHGFPEPPKTWSELSEIATTISNGKGKAAGFSPQSAKLPDMTGYQAAGGPSSIYSGIDYRTGRAAMSDPSLVNAVELFRKLQAESVLQKGWESWDATRAFTEFSKQSLAMYTGGGWHVSSIRELNPEVDLGITTVPIPDSGRGGYIGKSTSFGATWGMSSQTEKPEQAWQLLDFLISEPFQRAYFERFTTFTAVETVWRDSDSLSDDQKAILAAGEAQTRRVPNPQTVSGAGEKLMGKIGSKPDLKPTDGIVAAVTRNENFAETAAELDPRLDAFIDESVAGLQSDGVGVDRSVLTFPDWDPLKEWSPR